MIIDVMSIRKQAEWDVKKEVQWFHQLWRSNS